MVIMKVKHLKRSKAKLSTAEVEVEHHADDGAEQIPQEIRIIAQEVKIVRSLACNDVNKRNRQLRKLRKWFQLRTRSSFPFSEEDFLRIWKGLYYNMWMSDKPLVQEELAEQLGQLLECFDGDVATSVNFFGAFIQIMCNEWFGIDQWRIDKFMMLTRRMLRYMFRVLKSAGWTTDSIQLFNEHMTRTVLAAESPALGLTMHYLDIFFEELAKVSEGKISAEQVGDFVRPFVNFLGTVHDVKLVSHCRKQVLYHLLYQSTLGREYTDKYTAWKHMGFPTASIHDLELEELTPEEVDEGEDETIEETAAKEDHLDPRAGNVDVVMPELPFDGKYVIEELEKQIYKNNECCTKRRKVLRKLLELVQRYQNGEFPLGVKRMPRFVSRLEKPLMKDKIEQLDSLESEMYGVGRKLKQLNKRKRRKLLNTLNLENVDESNFDQTVMKALPKQYLKERERKRKAQSAMMSGWVEEEIESEESVTPKKKAKNKLREGKSVEVEKVKLSSESGQFDAKLSNIAPEEPARQVKNYSAIQVVENEQEKSAVDPQPAKKKAKKLAQLIEKNYEAEKTAADCSKELKAADTNVAAKPKIKSIASAAAATTITTGNTSEWDTPLSAGDIEYFIPSRKIQLRKANANLVLNPLANKAVANPVKLVASTPNTPKTRASAKRVKIALKNNTIQNPSEYIRQIKSSPNLPYDADKKPGKGLLKPHSMPSPINPFYKKKIGLRLMNDTL